MEGGRNQNIMRSSAQQQKKKRHRKEAADGGTAVGKAEAMAMSTKKKRIEPLIIHSVSPPVVRADPCDFRRMVQILTGCPETRRRCEDVTMVEDILNAGGNDPSPASCGSPAPAGSSLCSSISSAATSSEANHASSVEDLYSSARGGTVEDASMHPLQKMSTPSPSLSSPSVLSSAGDHTNCFLGMDSALSRQSLEEQRNLFADSAESLRSQTGPHHQAVDLQPSIMEMKMGLRAWLSSYDQDGYWSNFAVFEYVDDPLSLH